MVRKTRISEFFHFLDVDLSQSTDFASQQAVQAFVPVRLGRCDSANLSKPRPIKIVLRDEKQVCLLLNSINKKGTDINAEQCFKSVRASSDKTDKVLQ